MTTKKYFQPYAPTGSMVGGEFLRSLILDRGQNIDVIFIDGEAYQDRDQIEEIAKNIEDNEKFAVMINGNSKDVEFVLLFSNQRVIISTGEQS